MNKIKIIRNVKRTIAIVSSSLYINVNYRGLKNE